MAIMDWASDELAKAAQHYQAGHLQAAERSCAQILSVAPGDAEALHLWGLIANRVGQHDVAIDRLKRATRLKPVDATFHYNLGVAYRAAQRLDEAIASYRRALEISPRHAQANNNLGNALKDQGKLDEAVASYRRALEINPTFVSAHNNLGTALSKQEKPDEAVACFLRALEISPYYAVAHNNLGNALKELGRPDAAVASYRRAIEIQPEFVAAHNHLGRALCAQGELAAAVASHQRALQLSPDDALALNFLAIALREQGQVDEAIACWERARRLKPDYFEAHNNLGIARHHLGNLEAAVACYEQALQSKPNHAEALNNLGTARKDQGNLAEAVDCYRQALSLKPEYSEAHSNLLYTLIFCPDVVVPAIVQEHDRWNERHAEALSKRIQPQENERSENRCLRVGYVSPDFRDHVVGRNMWPLIREHDHARFEITCYSQSSGGDQLTARFRSAADAWRDVRGLTDEALSQLIRQDRIDILVDLTLHMGGNRLLTFARRPAPVQVTFAGYPGTTGLATIDYRLTDPYLDPPGLNDDHYTEESIRLAETFWCYDPLGSEPGVNSLPARDNGYVTFGCLNNFCKVNSAVLKLWAQVLTASAHSRLLILAPEGAHRQHTLDRLEQEGVRPQRVTFFANQPRPQYLELYHGIDLGLDTFPYNGHTTSLDSLWMGVPVITLVGQTVVGRAGLSQLTNVGLPELVARTPERFVTTALELAQDLPRLGQLRATLRERMQNSPLMDAPRFARSIEAAYRKMWQRYCDR